MKSNVKTVGFKKGERNVFFHILTACNLSCKHCYINTEQHGSETLEREQVIAWLKLFHDPGRKSNLVFLGGEPTMHKDLAEFVRIAKNLDYTVTVDTNGYIFHKFLERVDPQCLDYLSFSLDGPDAEINDQIRGDGSYKTCITNLTKAQQRGFNVGVIYTVSKKNIDHVDRMIPLLSSLGIKRFFIQVIGLRGQSAQKESHDSQPADTLQVTRNEWLATVPRVAQMGAELGIHVTYPKVFLEDDEQFECAGLVADNYFIFPNGRVYQCPLCEDYPLHTYEINNDTLIQKEGINEKKLFTLDIPEGCVMNKLLQPDTIEYDENGKSLARVSCCLLKNEVFDK